MFTQVGMQYTNQILFSWQKIDTKLYECVEVKFEKYSQAHENTVANFITSKQLLFIIVITWCFFLLTA